MFSHNAEEYADFLRFRPLWGTWQRSATLDPLLKVIAPSPRLIRMRACMPTELKKTVFEQIISKKCMKILSYIGKLYRKFKQTVPESESRQFDRLRLRLRLLARRHDSGRLWLRLRLRLRTSAYSDESMMHSIRGMISSRGVSTLLEVGCWPEDCNATCFQRAVHFLANDMAHLENGIMPSNCGSTSEGRIGMYHIQEVQEEILNFFLDIC